MGTLGLISGAVFGLLAMGALGQTGSAAARPATQTLSLDARLVVLPVVVRDRKGAFVGTLGKDDFVLQVDGTPQTIRYFDHDQDLPLTVGLLVDTSLSQRKVLEQERTASQAFLDGMLRGPKDQAFVMQFARSAELLTDVTSSHAKLEAGLKDLGSDPTGGADPDRQNDPDAKESPDDHGGGARRHGGRAGTVLYDAAFLAADELMSKQRGRKALILLTDGDDHGSRETIARAIEAAERADTTIYAIYYKGSYQGPGWGNNDPGRQPQQRGGGFPFPGGGGYPGGGGQGGGRGGGQPGGGGRSDVDGKKILERMAGETGGRVFEVRGKEDVATIYQEIGDELRAQYRLGFTPDAAHATDGYHQVDLELRDAKLKDSVQTRDGYYSGKP